MKFRNNLATLHGAIGILAGLFLVIMGLTGSAIVFHQEIDRALNPHLMQVQPQDEPVTIESFLSQAQAALPNSRLESVQLPETPEDTYRLSFKSPDEIWRDMAVHPYTGEILGIRRGDRTLIGFLYAIHHDLLMGKIGLYFVGLCGITLMVQAVTGLMLWTGWRKLASGLRIRWSAPPRILSFDLHNFGGFVSNLFLLIIGFTGLVIVVAHLVLEPPHADQLPPPFQPTIAVSDLLRKADAALPEGTTTSIAFPDAQQMIVRKKLPQDHPRFYFSSVTVDSATGEVVAVNKVVEKPLLWKILVPIAELHFGTFGGLPTRVWYILMGLMLNVLFITGFVNWRHRWRMGQRRQAEHQTEQSNAVTTQPIP